MRRAIVSLWRVRAPVGFSFAGGILPTIWASLWLLISGSGNHQREQLFIYLSSK